MITFGLSLIFVGSNVLLLELAEAVAGGDDVPFVEDGASTKPADLAGLTLTNQCLSRRQHRNSPHVLKQKLQARLDGNSMVSVQPMITFVNVYTCGGF